MSTTKASSSLTIKVKEIVRVFVKKAEKQGRGKYNDYTPEERAAMGCMQRKMGQEGLVNILLKYLKRMFLKVQLGS